MRILFCGDTFASARTLLRERLPAGADDDVCLWTDPGVPAGYDNVDVLIPMMFRIDANVMDACRPRLIQQWGSGLEGVDLDAARVRGILVAGLDVYWQEPIVPSDALLALPNVIATPHVAGVTAQSFGEIADAVAANIELVRRGDRPINAMNG